MSFDCSQITDKVAKETNLFDWKRMRLHSRWSYFRWLVIPSWVCCSGIEQNQLTLRAKIQLHPFTCSFGRYNPQFYCAIVHYYSFFLPLIWVRISLFDLLTARCVTSASDGCSSSMPSTYSFLLWGKYM